MERINRKHLPDSLPTNGKSRHNHRQILHNEPAIRVKRTGKNCALTVRDQLVDQSLEIRVNFSEIDRAIRAFDFLGNTTTKENV